MGWWVGGSVARVGGSSTLENGEGSCVPDVNELTASRSRVTAISAGPDMASVSSLRLGAPFKKTTRPPVETFLRHT